MKTIGLVGCGVWGKNILRDLIRLDCTVYVTDINEDACLFATDAGAANVFSSFNDLPVCDGYVVAVPIPDLAPVCAGLLPRAKPVFAEKTLCLSMEDYELLKSNGGEQRIFAMHKWHYHSGIEELRRIASSGILGEIRQIHTVRHNWVVDFHGGDVFWTQAVHDITIIKHILGYIPQEVKFIDVIKTPEGLPVSFIASIGETPNVLISVSGRYCSRRSGASIIGSEGAAELYNAYDSHIAVWTGSGEQKVPVDASMPLYLELKEFAEYLSGGPKPRCGLEDAWEASQAILNLRKAAMLK
jgi:Predicted dehydrogenases and related proteins